MTVILEHAVVGRHAARGPREPRRGPLHPKILLLRLLRPLEDFTEESVRDASRGRRGRSTLLFVCMKNLIHFLCSNQKLINSENQTIKERRQTERYVNFKPKTKQNETKRIECKQMRFSNEM